LDRVLLPWAGLPASPTLLKVGGFFGVWFFLWLPLLLPLAIALQWRPSQPPTPQQKIPLVLSLYGIAPLLLWLFANLEGVPFASYGLTWDLRVGQSIGIGIAIAILGLAILFAIPSMLGWVRWQPPQFKQLPAILALTLGLGLAVSLVEEWVFRGFLLNQMQSIAPPLIAAIAASIIFAILHLLWDGRAGLPQLPGLWLMGMVLVLARWVDGNSLGLAIGLHTGWIWGMASLDTAQVLQYCDLRPRWITGFGDSPLAGILGILLLGGTGAILWWF